MMQTPTSLRLYVAALGCVAWAQQTYALAASPDAQHAARSPAPLACQADCAQACQQIPHQELYWTQQSFAAKVTVATVLEVYNNILDATRTIIQYNNNADLTTYTNNGVESTFMGGYTLATVPYGAQQTSQTATYVATSGDVPVIETVTFGTAVTVFPNTITWSGSVPTTVQGTPTCLVHNGFQFETLPSAATVTSVQPVASDDGFLGPHEDPYGLFWSPVYRSDVDNGEQQTYLAQFYPNVAALSPDTCPIASPCNAARPRAAGLADRQVNQGATYSPSAIGLTATSSITETGVSTVTAAAETQVAMNVSVPLPAPTAPSSAVPISGGASSSVSSTSAPSFTRSTSISTRTTSQTLIVGSPLPLVFSTLSRSEPSIASTTSAIVLSSSTSIISPASVVSGPSGLTTSPVSASTTISLQEPGTSSPVATAAAASVVSSAPLLSLSPSLLYNGSTATFALTQSSVAVVNTASVFFPGNISFSPNATATARNATGTRGIVPFTGAAVPITPGTGHGAAAGSIITFLGSMLAMWLW